MDYGEKLRAARKQRRLTQQQLADKSGVDYTYISKLENGRIDPPSEQTTRRIAAVLEVDVEELLSLSGKINRSLKDAAVAEPQLAVFLRTLSSNHRHLSTKEYQDMTEVIRRVSGSEGKADGETL